MKSAKSTPKKAVKPAYKEPMRPMKPNSNADKGKPLSNNKSKKK